MKQKNFKERGWKRLLGLVLALVMVFTLSPMGSITAYAMGITVTVVNSGTNIQLDVEPSTSVETVKGELAEPSGISIENQILKYGDTELDDNNKVMADYNILSNATLTLESKSDSGSAGQEAEYDIKYSEIRNNGSGKAYPVGTRIYMDIKPKVGTDNEDAPYFFIDSLETAITYEYITVDGAYDTSAQYFYTLNIQLKKVITLEESYVNSGNKVIKSGGYWIFNLNNEYGDEFYGVVASSEKDEYKNIKLDIAGSASHTHQWNYTLSEDGKTITAHCTNTDGDCEYREGTGLTYSIEAENKTYSGKVYDGVSETNNITSVTGDEPSIKYYLEDGTTLTTAENSGATEAGGAPTNAGSYVVKVTIGEATATAGFEITQIVGSGTADDPYIISNTEELIAAINSNIDTKGKYYKLSDNFDNTTVLTEPLAGQNLEFAGTFDGNGKTVNVNINSDLSEVGLFRENKGQISNINVAGTISGSMYVGGICGKNFGEISNCNNSAIVTGTKFVGGISGYNQGSITGCSNDNSITAKEVYAGGITGKNGTSVKDAPVNNCTNSGNVTCDSYKNYTGYNDSKMAYLESDGSYKVIGKAGNAWQQIHNDEHDALYTEANSASLSVRLANPEIISDGSILKFTITIKNNTSEEVDGAKVAVYGDTEISGCDRSVNKTNANKTIMDMSYNDATFFAFSKDSNFKIVNTSLDEIGANQSSIDVSQVNEKCDSAYSAQWNIESIAGGETVTRTFYIGCTQGENLSEAELNKIVNAAVHTHDWRYSVDGNKVEVYCAAEGCTSGTSESEKRLLTLSAADADYSGEAYTGASIENNITEITGDAASDITYVGRGETSYEESTTAPTDAGTYTAKVTIGEKTAIADFEIAKADITPTVSLADWVYGKPVSSPVLEGNLSNGSVTYYYKARGVADSTYVKIGGDLDFSNIPSGQYTLKACIGETTNYNAAEATCDFAVAKNSITVNVTMAGWTYGDKAKTPSVTVKADDKDITSSYEESQITYTYYTDVDCTNKTTSANGAVSDGAVPKNAGTYYVKADVEATDNYSEGSAVSEFTIAKKQVTAKVTVKDKTYDGTLNADVVAAVSDSDLVAGDQLDIAGITGTFADKNAGDNKQVTVNGSDPTVTGTGADNYDVTIDESETITATIKKRVVELKWDSNPAYTGNEQSMTATVSNAIEGDSFDLRYTGNTGTNVGDTYTAKVTDLGNENYTLVGSKTVEQKWSISYLETEAAAEITQVPEGTNGWYKQDVIVKAPQGYQISEDGKTWKDSLSYTEDGTYTKNYYLKDAEGHITDKKVLNFKIDKTAPTGTVKIKEKVFDKPLNQITYGCFFKDNAEITIEGADVTSDIAKIEYQKVPKGDTFDENGTWTEGKTLSIAANDKAVIYVRLTDKAGNQSIINTDGIVVYTDATATSKETFTKTSSADVTTGITVNGNTIASVMIKNADDESAEPTQVDASNYEIKNDKLVLKASYLQTLAAGGYTLTVNYNPYGETYVEGDKPNTSVITFTINRSKGSMTDISDISKVYDGTPVGTPTFITTNDRGTADANVTVEYKKQDADDSTYTKDAPKNYGEYVVRITVKADGNYESISATKEFSIAKKEMQVSAEGYTGTYDGQVHGIAVKVINPADSAASNAKVVYGTKGADGNITYSETPVTYKDAGAYTVYYKVIADNYVDAAGSAVIEIEPKTVSLAWSDTEFTYDGKSHKPSAKVSDVDIIGSDSVDVAVTGEQKNVGEYTAKATVSGNNNYILGADAGTAFVIKKAAVTVTVDHAAKHIGKDDPKFTYKVTGLVEGESLKDITVARTEGETVGSYDITATVKDGSNANYDVTFVAGKLTIEDHTAVVDKAVAATCTETGLTEGSHCSVCNEVLVAQTVVDAFGHDWSEWVKMGNREKSTCSRCGQVKYRNIETADTGSFEKDAEVAPGAPITEATLDNNKSELIAADGIFTEEERADIESGAVARVWIEISATSNLADADKQNVEAEAKKIMGSDISKVVYFDADLFKSVTKDGTTTKSQITEPGTEIEVSVSLPESLVQADSTISRAYRIIRLHNGEVDSFVAAFDKETGTLTFKTDRFSTYAIAFTDTQLVTGITLTPDSKTLTKKGETVQLTATVTPDNAANKKVTWTSSDSKVATVDENGLVTAVANGTAIITVTTEDGGETATAEITVNISSEDDNNSDKDNGSSDSKPATVTTDNKNNTGTAKTDNHSDATHQTGDTSNLALWVILFMASFAGLIGLLVKRKKENGK